MPRWKIRDPNIYPIKFFDIVEEAARNPHKPILLHVVRNSGEARAYLDRFRAWRFCLRSSTSTHRCSNIENSSRITARTKHSPGLVEIWITVKPRIASSFFDLNPELLDLAEN